MSYNKSVKIKDYQGRSVELSEQSWEHIQESHPEITMDDIKSVLGDPLEVRQSPKKSINQEPIELFYQVKTHPEGRLRFKVVVVKVLKDGLFVSTAMTTNAMKAGETLCRKDEGEVL
ncbi:MAG: hypothetical protein KA715_01240 [Xanthomonadaceae bacterium]|nr:hypothetical protein [Xanthomonadaceae bacterium]